MIEDVESNLENDFDYAHTAYSRKKKFSQKLSNV